jgi:hypothetical protein
MTEGPHGTVRESLQSMELLLFVGTREGVSWSRLTLRPLDDAVDRRRRRRAADTSWCYGEREEMLARLTKRGDTLLRVMGLQFQNARD